MKPLAVAAVILVSMAGAADDLADRIARVRKVADGVCAITNVTIRTGAEKKEVNPLLANFAAIEEVDLKSRGAYVQIDFVLKPEPGSDIRCRAAFPAPERWSGRFLGTGNSGYGGALPSVASPAAYGFAVVTTELGTWAYTECGRSNRMIWPKCVCDDYDWRATHLMTVYGKRLAAAFYGRKADMNYFHGGSCGGRQAFSEMLRFPEDYDGVIASLPGNNAIGKELDIFALWKQTHDADGKLLFSTNEMHVVADAAVEYGARREPRPYAGRCLSDPFFGERDIDGFLALAAKKCPRLGDPDLQRRLKTVYLGWTHKGRRVTHGEIPGAYVGKQMSWSGITYLPQFLRKRGLAMKTATWDDMDDFVREYGPGYNSCSTDLEAFRRRGGKLIVTVALEDQTVPTPGQISHFERTVRRYGGDLEAVQKFYRLFCIPGCSHGGGVGRVTKSPGGPNVWDRIVAWREKGVAPERIDAYHRGRKETWPLAVYPKRFVQDGEGKWIETECARPVVRDADEFYLQTRISQQASERFAERLLSSFEMTSEQSVIGAADCGLVNGYVTLNGWIEDVATVKSIWAPPYFSRDFALNFTFNGADAKATGYVWRPETLTREGTVPGWRLKSRLVPIARSRGAILAIEAENTSGTAATLEIRHAVAGEAQSQEKWGFGKPKGDGKRAVRLAVGASAGQDGRVAFEAVPSGGRRTAYYAMAIGEPSEADAVVAKALADPEGTIAAAQADWRGRVRRLAEKMPRFDSDDPSLVRLYDRSLLHLLMVEWNLDWFVTRPYYATGGLAGGCLCNYLWNFGEPYRLWPLLNPEALKAHLKTFLKLDLEDCYSFAPADGAPLGPYYPINQEKIVLLIDAYVRETGDTAFLKETFNGRTMVEWVIKMALTHDDLAKEAVLHDYGKSNSHLELRTGKDHYNGVMPDLNLRRVRLLRMADRLCKMAGHDPGVDLVRRADALKALCRRELWDEKADWFRVRCADGKTKLRWTMQMFKAFGGGALDRDVETAMLGHLMNEREFLGAYGIHSLSKLDPVYDPNDIDNGGPGACPSFAPAICDRLYRDGYFQEANEIFMRLRWLGESLPYWGDSQYADRRDYRRDTPLQCDVEGACLAQTMVFGMFGIRFGDDLSVSFDPHLPDGVNLISLANLRLCGKTYDLAFTRDGGLTVDAWEATDSYRQTKKGKKE